MLAPNSIPRPKTSAVLLSPRNAFQWKWFWYYLSRDGADSPFPDVLNIGCSNDPVEFGEWAVHADLDDWSAYHKHFVQLDVQNMPQCEDQSFGMVILGDVLEHIPDTQAALDELMRVCRVGGFIVLTIFEEWRLPGDGQWIVEGQSQGDSESIKQGAKDRLDFQATHYPGMISVDDDEHPHLCHINQFTSEDIDHMVSYCVQKGFVPLEALKMFETMHEGHPIYNWLICLGRVK